MPLVVKAPLHLSSQDWLAPALAALNRGGIVLFPTETVYGIGVRADNRSALGKLRMVKQKPRTEPLLLHCAEASTLEGWAGDTGEVGRRLSRRFWPGPLTLVVPRGELAPAELTAGRATVGIRMVADLAGRQLLRQLDCPLAGTSANFHDRPPAGDYARLDLKLLAAVDVAVDAGACGSGTASTVLDLTGPEPRLIRAGAVPVAELESLLGWRLGPAPAQ
jgi:L-threonylcarbamoyladenylate synthase